MFRILFPILLLIIFSVDGFSQNSGPRRKRIDYELTSLENGLSILSINDPSIPIIKMGLFFKAGATYEDKEENGLISLCEKMIHQPPKGNFTLLEPLQREGIKYGLTSSTGSELSSFSITVPPEQFLEGLKFFREKVSFTVFSTENKENSLRILANDFSKRNSDPFYLLETEIESRMYGRNAYKKDVLGDFGNILNFPPESMVKIFTHHFQPQNALLGIAGKLKDIDFKALADSALGEWSPDSVKRTRELNNRPAVFTETFKFENDDLKSSLVMMAWPGPGADESIMDCLLADVFLRLVKQKDGQFYRSMVEGGKAKLAGFRYELTYLPEPIKLVLIPFETYEKSLITNVIDEISKFGELGYFSINSLERVKEELLFERIYERDNSGNYLDQLADLWSMDLLPKKEEIELFIRKMSLEDITNFAKIYLIDKPYIGGLVYPPSQRSSIRNQEIFGKNPLGYVEPNKLQAEKINLEMSWQILFEPTSVWPIETSTNILDEVGTFLTKNSEERILIHGHADETGSERKNITLSKNRASAVLNYLVENHGVSAQRMTIKAFGESKPQIKGPKSSVAENRRVEIRIQQP